MITTTGFGHTAIVPCFIICSVAFIAYSTFSYKNNLVFNQTVLQFVCKIMLVQKHKVKKYIICMISKTKKNRQYDGLLKKDKQCSIKTTQITED